MGSFEGNSKARHKKQLSYLGLLEQKKIVKQNIHNNLNHINFKIKNEAACLIRYSGFLVP